MIRISWKIVAFGFLAYLIGSEVQAAMSFTEEPKGAFVAVGSRSQLNCSALTVFPTLKVPIYFWKHNGRFIQDGSITGITLQNKTLLIKSFSSNNHSGTYHCVAFHKDYGAIISKPAKLQAAYLWHQSVYNNTYTVTDASYVLINSSYIQAQPAIKFSWFYKQNDAYLSVDTTNTFLLGNGSLLIPSADSSYNKEFYLYVEHITLKNIQLLVSHVNLQVTGSSKRCPNAAIIFLQNSRNKEVNEGQDVVLECLAVAQKCRKKVEITWQYNGQNIGSSRKLVLKNIQKTSEGTYTCSAKIGNRTPKTTSFQVTVKEKPQVVIPIVPAIDISTAYTIRYGNVNGYKTIEWYTNGEKITGANSLFQVDSASNLKVRYPNPSVAGIYQIFFINDAGITVQSFMLYVDSKAGIGSKVTGKFGTVDFVPTSGQSPSTVYGSWLIQVPVPQLQPILLTISRPPKCSPSGITALNVYYGSTASGVFKDQYCSTGSQTYSVEMNGPFITLVLVTRDLLNSGFTVHFSLKPLVTTPPPSTTRATTNPSTSPFTTRKTPPVSSTTNAPTPTSTKQTVKSTVGGITDERTGSKVSVGAIVGAVVGVVAVVLIIVGIFCYRRRKYGKKDESSVAGKSGKNDTATSSSLENTFMRPAFESNNRDTKLPRFTVQARSIPDVVPSHHSCMQDDPSPYEMGCIGPGEQDADNQTYATVGEIVGNGGYPVIANQAYLPARLPNHNNSRRIPSAPGLPYSKSLTPRPTERPRELPLRGQQPLHRPSAITDDDDYLAPIDARTLPSPTDSNYSKASSNLSGPQYQVLEMGENVTYESADDVISGMEKLDNITRNPSDRSESRYAALHDDQWASKENSVYEPLTLGRAGNSLKDFEDGKTGQKSSPAPKHKENAIDTPQPATQKENVDPELDDDYADPYEEKIPDEDPHANIGDDYSEPFEPGNQNPEDDNGNVYEPLNEDMIHHKLQGKNSKNYTTLDGAGNGSDEIGSLQPLHLQADDNVYAEI